MTTKTVDLNSKLKDYSDGKQVELPETLAQCLAQMLKTSQTQEVVKFYGWFVSLSTTGKLTLDQADRDALESFIKGHQGAVLLLKGQLLQELARHRD